MMMKLCNCRNKQKVTALEEECDQDIYTQGDWDPATPMISPKRDKREELYEPDALRWKLLNI